MTWHVDFCWLNEDRWPRIGCDIPKYQRGGLPRVEISTPKHYISVALGRQGKFGKIRNYYSGMPREEMDIYSKWILVKRR